MNIFFVDKDPIKAAQCLVDAHCNKMVVESCQMLANCYDKKQLESDECPRTKSGNNRKYSYFNHPCSIWVRESIENFNWLLHHVSSLESERRWRGFNPHFCTSFITWCFNNPPTLPNIEMTPPAQAFGVEWEYLRGDNVVEAYRRYYNVAKRQQTTLKKVWTRRGAPDWWKE